MKKILFLLVVTSVSTAISMSADEKAFIQAAYLNRIEGPGGIKDFIINKKISPNVQDENGETALMAAVMMSHKAMIQQLLRMGADVNIKNNIGRTALASAIQIFPSAMVPVLLDNAYNINIDEQDNNGNTPLMFAIITTLTEVIEAVLDEVPNYTIKNNVGKTAQELLQDIPDSNPRKNEILESFKKGIARFDLYQAIIEEKSLGDIENIINSFPDILKSKIKSISRNPLAAAIRRNKLDIVKLLVNRDADVNQTLKLGFTPLMLAIQTPDTIEIVKFLLAQGANPNIPPEEHTDMTPLMQSIHSRINKIKALLDAGADIFAKNSQGKNALELAQEKFEQYKGKPEFLRFKQRYEQVISLFKEKILTYNINNLTQKLKILQKALEK